MASFSWQILVTAFATTVLAGCAQIGAPVPPSLELPRPVADLRATRKGESVQLNWTPPTRITDGQTIRHLGPTRICRSLLLLNAQCDTVAQIPPSSSLTAQYSDRLPPGLIKPDPNALVGYKVEVLNSNERSAGLSNVAPIPLFVTLASTQNLSAQMAPQGVALQWNWPQSVPQTPGLDFRLRIYRRNEAGKSDIRVAEVNLQDEPKFLDQSIEWEKTYFYRTTFVSVSSAPGGMQVEGEDSPEIKVSAHDTFPPSSPPGCKPYSPALANPTSSI